MSFFVRLAVDDELTGVLRATDERHHHDGPRHPFAELVTVLGAQCLALAATGGISFVAGGFGQQRWPVDVQTDLAVIIEQLPDVLARLRREATPFQLDFYEQGIERYLTVVRRGDSVTFECVSMSLGWTADPSEETLSLAETQSMFLTLRDTYVATVGRVCPWLADAPAFRLWCAETGARRDV